MGHQVADAISSMVVRGDPAKFSFLFSLSDHLTIKIMTNVTNVTTDQWVQCDHLTILANVTNGIIVTNV